MCVCPGSRLQGLGCPWKKQHTLSFSHWTRGHRFPLLGECKGPSSEFSLEGATEEESLTLPSQCLESSCSKQIMKNSRCLEGEGKISGKWGDGVGKPGCLSVKCETSRLLNLLAPQLPCLQNEAMPSVLRSCLGHLAK